MDSSSTQQYIHSLEQDGFVLVRGVFEADSVRLFADLLETAFADTSKAVPPSRRGGSVYALRNVLTLPAVQAIVTAPPMRSLIESVLGPGAFTVRGILFDKTPGANWKVAYHQDLAVPVQKRVELPGWSGWSVKAGVVHAQPPASILEKMVTTRLHLDSCGFQNGPLRVLPGTHRYGRLSDVHTDELRQTVPEVVCTAEAGDVLLMHPLLLHASSAAQHPARRRVLHIEWTAQALPDGLAWAAAA